MNPRTFNSIMPRVNERWVASVLNMELNDKGVDLSDKDKCVEVKFHLLRDPLSNYISWKVQEYQIKEYTKGCFMPFWAFGTYEMKTKVKSIRTRDEQKLEALVAHRTLYIVEWEWVKQFKKYYTFGETEHSSWEHTLRYPKHSKLPKVMNVFEVPKGLVYIDSNIPTHLFFKK